MIPISRSALNNILIFDQTGFPKMIYDFMLLGIQEFQSDFKSIETRRVINVVQYLQKYLLKP